MANELKLYNSIENFLITILDLPEETLLFLGCQKNQNHLFIELWNLGCDFFDLIKIYASAGKVNQDLGEIISARIMLGNDTPIVSLDKLNSLFSRWTGTKYHSGNKAEVLQDIRNKVISCQSGVHIYNSNLNIHNPRAYNDIYILIVSKQKNLFIDVNRRKIHEILMDLSYNKVDLVKDVSE